MNEITGGKQLKNKTENLQDIFLNSAIKEKSDLIIFLKNGVSIKGKVLSFDTFSIIVNVDNRQNFIYKNLISTISPLKSISYREEKG